ncbi:MAG: hypothetical protein IPO05_11545 [Flavobacteriales bacterium]|jgi:hypothetical protein|nr:hypothetical protein [Flavobacteriales bacterium]MBK9514229.1 hypothetical protein [Flavobacteriales bacterium]MBP7449039.1 hypothetical protein [Flavobacteriales bacterium]HOZ41153.1 hypothetical protein [Flavobacteriales bacterium]
MKRTLIYTSSALILFVIFALVTGMTYGAQVLFFTLILLFFALLVRVMVAAFEGYSNEPK